MRLTTSDFVGLATGAVSLIGGTVLLMVVAPAYRKMFEDFGSPLPLLTRVALHPVAIVALGTLPMTIVGGAIAFQAPPPLRAVTTGVAAFLLVLLIVAFFIGMYMPIFQMADQIR